MLASMHDISSESIFYDDNIQLDFYKYNSTYLQCIDTEWIRRRSYIEQVEII